VREYRLPREAVNPEHLSASEVWSALLQDMPIAAMIRNLATMTRAGVLAPGSAEAATVVNRLGDELRIRRARLHPVAVLAALLAYRFGRGVRGRHSWAPVTEIVDALDGAFYASFGNVRLRLVRTRPVRRPSGGADAAVDLAAPAS
jgi:60 kDa SS-A/Ro ribonucleoprotein